MSKDIFITKNSISDESQQSVNIWYIYSIFLVFLVPYGHLGTEDLNNEAEHESEEDSDGEDATGIEVSILIIAHNIIIPRPRWDAQKWENSNLTVVFRKNSRFF